MHPRSSLFLRDKRLLTFDQGVDLSRLTQARPTYENDGDLIEFGEFGRQQRNRPDARYHDINSGRR